MQYTSLTTYDRRMTVLFNFESLTYQMACFFPHTPCYQPRSQVGVSARCYLRSHTTREQIPSVK